MTEEVLLTREGLEKIKEEYETAVSVTRAEVAERIKEAAELEERINKLETMIRNAKVIDEDDLEKDVVNVGNTVTLKENGKEEVVVYQIVGSTEADPFSGRISNESEVGKALIGAKIGETVEVEVPDGKISYDILKVSN